jgi:hypothetical protein
LERWSQTFFEKVDSNPLWKGEVKSTFEKVEPNLLWKGEVKSTLSNNLVQRWQVLAPPFSKVASNIHVNIPCKNAKKNITNIILIQSFLVGTSKWISLLL